MCKKEFKRLQQEDIIIIWNSLSLQNSWIRCMKEIQLNEQLIGQSKCILADLEFAPHLSLVLHPFSGSMSSVSPIIFFMGPWGVTHDQVSHKAPPALRIAPGLVTDCSCWSIHTEGTKCKIKGNYGGFTSCWFIIH